MSSFFIGMAHPSLNIVVTPPIKKILVNMGIMKAKIVNST
jgi:hypothetical protein